MLDSRSPSPKRAKGEKKVKKGKTTILPIKTEKLDSDAESPNRIGQDTEQSAKKGGTQKSKDRLDSN